MEQTQAPWSAPVASGPLDAVVELPGSKSATNRALILAALADGPSVLRRPLRSRDTLLMARGLGALGVDVVDQGTDWVVSGRPREGAGPDEVSVDVGNAGTVARFLPAVAALGTAAVRFDGDPRVRERPIGPLLLALRRLGVDLDRADALPMTIRGHGAVSGGAVDLDASSSSQFVSGLLLAAPRFEQGLVLTHVGGRLPSAPHVAMTVAALRQVGVTVQAAADTWTVMPGTISARRHDIEPDLSTAAAYLAAPLVAGGQVTVEGWPDDSIQPGAILPDLLAAMGAEVTRTSRSVTVRSGRGLHGLDADLGDAPELTMVLTALAALADSPSRFTGVAHIRLQETDRLAALATEITALGGDVTELADGLEIRPRPLTGTRVRSYDDHRVAMAWAVLGLAVPGIEVDDIATTGKTVPDFTASWDRMLLASSRP